MKKRKGFIYFIVLVFWVLNQPVAFAQSPPITIFPEWIDTVNYPQVTVHLSAWDSHGIPLENLQAEQFTLREDNGAIFHPDEVKIETNAPLKVVLALDISGSMIGKPLQDAKGATARFLDRLDESDQAALIAFADKIDPLPQVLNKPRELDFTSDLMPVYNMVEALEPGQQTPLYQAAAKAVRLFEDEPIGHRAVLLLSDGRNEPAENGDPDEAIRLAKEYHVPFLIIGLGRDIDQPYLERLATDTGGLFLQAPTSAELSEYFERIARLLKTQYELTYQSQLSPDGAIHKLSISLSAQGTLTESEILVGPLPPAPHLTETPLPQPTLTSIPKPIPTSYPTPPIVVTSATTCSPFDINCDGDVLGWILAAVIAILLSLAWVLRRRSSKVVPVVCAKCGYDLTRINGTCPQCGENKRLKKFNH